MHRVPEVRDIIQLSYNGSELLVIGSVGLQVELYDLETSERQTIKVSTSEDAEFPLKKITLLDQMKQRQFNLLTGQI